MLDVGCWMFDVLGKNEGYLIYNFYRGCQHFIIDRTIISCYFPSDLFISTRMNADESGRQAVCAHLRFTMKIEFHIIWSVLIFSCMILATISS